MPKSLTGDVESYPPVDYLADTREDAGRQAYSRVLLGTNAARYDKRPARRQRTGRATRLAVQVPGKGWSHDQQIPRVHRRVVGQVLDFKAIN